MAARSETFWRLLPDVRAGERSRFLFFAGLFTLVSLAQTMGLAGTEALFLAELGVARLPEAFIAASVFTVLGSMVYAVRVGQVRNDSLFIWMLLGAGLVLGAATVGVVMGQEGVILALFCIYYLTWAVFMNHFWTFSGDYFDTLSSKRLFPLFTIGASVGGVLGGLLAAALARLAGAASLIAGWGIALAAAAALLWLGRRALRRWGPLELEEADETSVESLRGAVRYLGASSLARWLSVSALGMVLAFFLAQYLYSDIFVTRFGNPTDLARFFALYFAATNLIEIVLEVAVTPRLIRRIGVAGANLIHPVLMLLSFGGLAWRQALPTGMTARMSSELLDNAMAAPIRSLMQNAMPPRLRGRVRAFLEGIVVYAGMAVAGFVLLPLDDPDPRWLCAAGAAASLFYLLANWRARRAYLQTLVSQLRAGRLDVADVSGAIGGWEASRLAELWEQALREEGRRPSASLLQLVPALAARGIVDPLVRAASHSNAAVRRSSVNALASVGGEGVAGPLALALDDPDSGVRLAALRGLARISHDLSFVESRMRDLLQDLDPRVRAEAALRAGAPGRETLLKMIASESAAEATAALGVAPTSLIHAVLERVGASDARIRAAALECAARIAVDPPLESDEVLRLLEDPEPAVRRAAVLLAANLDEQEVLGALARRIGDPAAEVQFAAETVLGTLGEDGVAAVESIVNGHVERSVEAALRVVAATRAPDARQVLLHQLRRRVREMWWHLIGYQRLPQGPDLALRFLRTAFEDAMLRERRLAFQILELLENPAVMRKVDRELRIGSSRSRADALEVLSNLGDRESARLLVLVHEAAPLEERTPIVETMLHIPADAAGVIHVARRSEALWIRMGAEALQPEEGDPPPEEETMQRLLALKQVDLFANLSFEQLDAVHQAASEAQYVPNEVIFPEGEHGATLYLLLEGAVDIVKDRGTPDELRLARLTAVDYFGEMAILADEPRSAAAVAASHCRLLTLEGTGFKELILQIPEISFEIFRVLTARVRGAEARLRER
jgi:CRP-like cAMP-binding protein